MDSPPKKDYLHELELQNFQADPLKEFEIIILRKMRNYIIEKKKIKSRLASDECGPL